MIFKIHYWLVAAGSSAIGLLIGVFMQTYTNAGPFENGITFMLMPISNIISKPVICSLADRANAHRECLMWCQLFLAITYTPFIVIPYLGEQVYGAHPRCCWWILVVCKVLGDMSFGGIKSVGDSLGINYAHRIGSPFGSYRIWSAISWCVFGIIIGLINEVWFMPKYVPGFTILIISSLLDMFVIWLYPPDYFEMVPIDRERERKKLDKGGPEVAESKSSGLREMFDGKTLLPNKVIWAHMKGQLLSLFCLGPKDHYVPGAALPADKKQAAPPQAQMDSSNKQQVALEGKKEACNGAKGSENECESSMIPLKSQLTALWILLQRDPRILLYCFVFSLTGMVMVPTYFFILNLSDICHHENRCDFSQLAGGIQVSIASAEVLLFVYVVRMQTFMGRFKLVALTFALISLKYGFYATYFDLVSPYFSMLSETVQGIVFGIYITTVVELAHVFSNEVEFILPELRQLGVVKSEADEERMRLSLSATMQAIVSVSQEGVGRASGALLFAFVLEHSSYETLWIVISLASATIFLSLMACDALNGRCKFVVGLEEKIANGNSAALSS